MQDVGRYSLVCIRDWSQVVPRVVRFDCFEVDLDAGILRKRGLRIGLRDQAFRVLASLLERPGQVVTRDDLRRRLWREEVFVDFDNSLNVRHRPPANGAGRLGRTSTLYRDAPEAGYRLSARRRQRLPQRKQCRRASPGWWCFRS